jgi:RNA polymerase sigma-70 factor (ECF subfamily)
VQLVHSSSDRRPRWSDASDRELLDGLRAGDEDALDELIGRKLGPLQAMVRRMVGDEEDARDIVQATFVRVWERRETYDPRWSPNTWIYRIATHQAIDFLRAAGSRERIKEPVRHHLRRIHARRAERQLADLQLGDLAAIFRDLLGGLSERQRAVFVLRELEDLSSREVSEILGCRESTVRNHLFNARRTLRRELGARYPEYARLARRERPGEGT